MVGMRKRSSYPVNHLHPQEPLFGAQDNQQNQILITIQEAKRMGTVLIFSGRVIHMAMAPEEKPFFLNLACQNSLADGLHSSRPTLLEHMGWTSPIVLRWFLRYPEPMSYRALKIIINILKSTSKQTGNQCSLYNSGVVWPS